MKIITVVCFLFIKIVSAVSQNITISGIIKEKGSQETILGANIYVAKLNKGAVSNNYGFYSLTIPICDSAIVSISIIGYKQEIIKITGYKSRELNVFLETQNFSLEEVTVKANEPEKKSVSVKVSSIIIPIQQLKDVPSLLGEKDIIKAIQLLPGVQNGTDGSNGLFVRGGSSDQNLVLMDEAKVYNISHLFGFFSIFNGDALKSMEFIKGGFPARYGGRVSSVLDVQMKDGNKTEAHGEIGIGLITNRFTFETPIKKNKSSFIVSARRTYPDLLLSLFKNADGGVLKSNFYDINTKINFDINNKNRLFVSGYFGKDNLFQRVNKSGDEFRNLGFSWGNQTGTIRLNHIFTPKIFSNLSLIVSKFNYSAENSFGASSQTFSSKLDEIGLKYDVEFFPNSFHTLKVGMNISNILFTPNLFISKDNGNRINNKEIEQIVANDGAFYIEDIYKPFEKLTLNYGLRIALFNPSNKLYSFFEPRIALNYNFIENWSIKGAYSIMNQPIQLLTNSGLGLSIDIWVPSTAKIPPQNSKQITLGIAHDFSKSLSLEFEVYTKQMKNIIAIKEGSSIFSTVNLFRDRDFTNNKILWEEISTQGNGEAKGFELFVKKNEGKLTGWSSYTLAKITNTFEFLNGGKSFAPIYDRRHQLSIVGFYQKNKKIKFTANFVVGSGTPITLPVLTYENFEINPFTNKISDDFNNIVNYGEQKNQYKTPFYYRLDLSRQKSKIKKHGTRTWELGVYNILGHRNIFAYEIDINGRFDSNKNFIRTKNINELSLLLFIPSISYYFKF